LVFPAHFDGFDNLIAVIESFIRLTASDAGGRDARSARASARHAGGCAFEPVALADPDPNAFGPAEGDFVSRVAKRA
jgi:hypothetical protein